MAFALNLGARHSLSPPSQAGHITTPQASLTCYGPHLCFPSRAFDTGLRPRPFPDEAASLLPGLLATTRTGLSPANNDELTNNKIRRYVTASPPALLGAQVPGVDPTPERVNASAVSDRLFRHQMTASFSATSNERFIDMTERTARFGTTALCYEQ